MHALELWAEIAIIILVMLFGLITVALLGGIAFALTKLNKLAEKGIDKLEPVVVKASGTLDSVQRVAVSVGEKADHILSKGEELTDSVTVQVEKTATVVEKAVTTPLINLSSLISGVSRGVSAWSHAARGEHVIRRQAVRNHGLLLAEHIASK